jgi:hypothetical protein
MLVALPLAALLAAAPARADWEVGVGPIDEIEGEGSFGGTLAYLTTQKHPWEVALGHFEGRDADAPQRTPDVTFVGFSKRLVWKRFYASLGVALTDSDNDVLSGNGQFMTGAGWMFGNFSVSFRHLSNANTGGRNRGENILLFHYRF